MLLQIAPYANPIKSVQILAMSATFTSSTGKFMTKFPPAGIAFAVSTLKVYWITYPVDLFAGITWADFNWAASAVIFPFETVDIKYRNSVSQKVFT